MSRPGHFALGLLLMLLVVPPAPAVEQAEIDKAVAAGVQYLKRGQGRDGQWAHVEIGATALATLTLLECGVPADDPAVTQGVDAVRLASPGMDQTYSISLSILLFDRLGDPGDVPLIESLAVRLLAGQNSGGGWSYNCPGVGDAEMRRLSAHLRQQADLRAARQKPEPAKGPEKKRTVKDVAPEVQQQLTLINRVVARPDVGMGGGDNSNTQFATLALWVSRRHGMPVDLALARVDARFRQSQNPDGGWGYMSVPRGRGGMGSSTATMTAAGCLALAVNLGALIDPDKEGPKRDLNADGALKAGLQALGTAVGNPVGRADRRHLLGAQGGRAYYFLWSLERVAVALNLKTIGNKDWYAWGAEVLIANQRPDGSWQGEYAGPDTCFALLFLRKANLARDLTARLGGKMQDPGEVTLKGGGVGGTGLTGKTTVASPLDPGTKLPDDGSGKGRPDKAGPKPAPVPAEPTTPAGRLGVALVKAGGGEQERLLKELRESKGVEYTEALAMAIPRLEGDAQVKARQALVDRFIRMTPKTLGGYLTDTHPEIRRAACLAVGMMDYREHIPGLIERLDDLDAPVGRAAYASLRAMTKQDFGPKAEATADERRKAMAAWKEWWQTQGGK